MTNAIVPVNALQVFVSRKDELLAALPSDVERDRFYAVAISLLKDPAIKVCTQESQIDSVYRFVKLGLDPDKNMGEGYIIPRNNSVKIDGQWVKKMVACFQVGYRGLTKLARRSSMIADIHAEVVYVGEQFKVRLGTHRIIDHDLDFSKPRGGQILCSYATWRDLQSGVVNFHVIDQKRIDRARMMNLDRDGKPAGPWRTDEGAMVRKTSLIDASKMWPLSAQLAEAIAVDQQAEGGEAPTPAMPVKIGVETVQDLTPPRSELDDFGGEEPEYGGEPVQPEPEPQDDPATAALRKGAMEAAKASPVNDQGPPALRNVPNTPLATDEQMNEAAEFVSGMTLAKALDWIGERNVQISGLVSPILKELNAVDFRAITSEARARSVAERIKLAIIMATQQAAKK